jgi:hypothetical protein
MRASQGQCTDLKRSREKTRKAYESPRIIYREQLEAIAGLCVTGKADATPQCLAQPSS